MPDDPLYECPHCEVDVPLPGSCWDCLSEPFRCPNCDRWVVLEGDYCDSDSWYFTLVDWRPS